MQDWNWLDSDQTLKLLQFFSVSLSILFCLTFSLSSSFYWLSFSVLTHNHLCPVPLAQHLPPSNLSSRSYWQAAMTSEVFFLQHVFAFIISQLFLLIYSHYSIHIFVMSYNLVVNFLFSCISMVSTAHLLSPIGSISFNSMNTNSSVGVIASSSLRSVWSLCLKTFHLNRKHNWV